MDKFKLKNGQEVIIREAEKEDAQELIDFYNIVGGETDFLSFGKNEFNISKEPEEEYLENIKSLLNSTLVLAILNEKIIGSASIDSNQKHRKKHVGTLGIVIKKEFCNIGLGYILINYLINWSKSNGVTKKISLITRIDNNLAIKLYEKLGFRKEGILLKDNYVDGIYYDSLYMGLLL